MWQASTAATTATVHRTAPGRTRYAHTAPYIHNPSAIPSPYPRTDPQNIITAAFAPKSVMATSGGRRDIRHAFSHRIATIPAFTIRPNTRSSISVRPKPSRIQPCNTTYHNMGNESNCNRCQVVERDGYVAITNEFASSRHKAPAYRA